MDLAGILQIHDYKFKENGINHEIKHSELASAIAKVHSSEAELKSWNEWLGSAKTKGRLTSLPPVNDTSLKPFWTVLQKICGERVTPEVLAEVLAKKLKNFSLGSLANWLHGGWLEDYAFEALQNAMKRIWGAAVQTDPYCGKNLKAEQNHSRDFELDLAAVLGYQFLAISCKAGQQQQYKGEAKLALFEAYVRATQLGGDEARAGLVCCSQAPKTIEDELADAWDAEGKIKVFGMFDLMSLENRFFDWLEVANKRRIVT
ncbi:MAG: Card1-like endonuclease domain-containing protein [bacterium]